MARGPGSGHGKTAGRGHNGQKSRSGSRRLTLSEGGQMPLFRRLPKRGFSNFKFTVCYQIINVCQLERFEDGAVVGIEQMSNAGLVGSSRDKVKVLGDGELTKRLTVTANKFSKSAEQKIHACGGITKVV